MIKLPAFCFVSSLLAMFVTACSSDGGNSKAGAGGASDAPDSDVARSSLTAYCYAACDKIVECESSKNPSEAGVACRTTCFEATQGARGKVNEQPVEQLTTCAKSLRCGEHVGFFTCSEKNAAEVVSSDAGKQACEAMKAAYERCDTKFVAEEWLFKAAYLSDDTLQDTVNSCANAPCGKLRKCIESSIGISTYTSLENLDNIPDNIDEKKDDQKAKEKKVADRCKLVFKYSGDVSVPGSLVQECSDNY